MPDTLTEPSVRTLTARDRYGRPHEIPLRLVPDVTWQCVLCERVFLHHAAHTLLPGLPLGAYSREVRVGEVEARACARCIVGRRQCCVCTCWADPDEMTMSNGRRYCQVCYDPNEAPDYRDWTPGPFPEDGIEGEYIRTSRTVGVEYEMMGRGNRRNILPEVGLGTDPTANIEVRTPPASGQAAERFTSHTLTQLLANGWRPGYDAGLHVHVHFPEAASHDDRMPGAPTCGYPDCSNPEHKPEESELTDDQRAKLHARARFLALWLSVEAIAYRFDPGRRTNSYSVPMLERGISERVERVASVLERMEYNEYVYPPDYDRYQGANFQALERYHTIEFRCHGSTDDVPHVLAWVAFCQALIDLSMVVGANDIVRLAHTPKHDLRAERLLQLFEGHKVVTPTALDGIRRIILPERT